MDIYKNEFLTLTTPNKPAVVGHVDITTTSARFEELTPKEFTHLFSAALFCGNKLFETGQAQGSNLFIEDIGGVHASVILRQPDDMLSFHWDATKLETQELDSIAEKIKDRCDYIGIESPEQKKEMEEKSQSITIKKEEQKEIDDEGRVRNYLLQKINRIP